MRGATVVAGGALPMQRPAALTKDRRLAARVAAHLPVTLRLAGMPPLPARTRDIGIGGACIQSRSILPLDAIEGVTITFPSREVSVEVEACWSSAPSSREGPLTGLRFLTLGNEDRDYTWEFTQQRGRDIARFLRESRDLEGLDYDDSFELALFTRIREVPHGCLVYRQADLEGACSSVYLVYRGVVTLEANVGPQERLKLGDLDSGGLFGGLTTYSGHAALESAIAAQPSTLLELDAYSIAYLERAKPLLARVLGEAVVRMLAKRSCDVTTRYIALRKVSRSRATGDPV